MFVTHLNLQTVNLKHWVLNGYSNGNNGQYKEIFVELGYLQHPGLDYEDVLYLVLNYTKLR